MITSLSLTLTSSLTLTFWYVLPYVFELNILSARLSSFPHARALYCIVQMLSNTYIGNAKAAIPFTLLDIFCLPSRVNSLVSKWCLLGFEPGKIFPSIILSA